MKASFIYMPVLRVRTHELELLKSFDFGPGICPCIEIIKEKGRQKTMSFFQFYSCVILAIKSDKVFVDIPFQLKLAKKTKVDVINFLTAMRSVEKRNKALLELSLADKMIPVISSYHNVTGVPGTIKKQVDQLRPTFRRLAFRISAKDPQFESELDQVEPFLTSSDHLLVDFDYDAVDTTNSYTSEIKKRLSEITVCPIVIIKNAIDNDIKYRELTNDEEVVGTQNNLLKHYKSLHASAFGDYAGIKKDLMLDGTPDPTKTIFGSIFFDPTMNAYYGYKGNEPGYNELRETVIPAIKGSAAIGRMTAVNEGFLSPKNVGWNMLHSPTTATPGDLKRVAMEHYVHSIKVMIDNGTIS